MFPWQVTVQDQDGKTIFYPLITIYQLDGVTLADIYDENGNPLDNPLTGTSAGFVQFWAGAGEYMVIGASDAATTNTWYITLGNSGVPEYMTVADAVASTRDLTDYNVIKTAGYYSGADGGGATYLRTTSAVKFGGFTTGDGSKWNNAEKSVLRTEEFGIVSAPLGSTQWDDQSDRMQSLIDMASEDGAMIQAPSGVIGLTGGILLRPNTKLQGVDPELTQFYSDTPYITTIGCDPSGAGNLTLRNFRIDGGWDKQSPNTGWNFNPNEPVFDNIYGLDIIMPWGDTDANRDRNVDANDVINNITVYNIAGTGIRVRGGGGNLFSNLRVQQIARYGLLADVVDSQFANFDISVTGLAALYCPASANYFWNGKLWYVGGRGKGDPIAAIVQGGPNGWGSSNNVFSNIGIQETNSPAIWCRGYSHVFKDIKADALCQLARVSHGSGRDSTDRYAVVLDGCYDCDVDIVVSDFQLPLGEVADLEVARLNSSNNNTIKVTANNGRVGPGAKTVCKMSVSDSISNYNDKSVNWISTYNGAEIMHGNSTGLNTMMLTDPSHWINHGTSRNAPTRRYLSDLEAWVTSAGATPSAPWKLDNGSIVDTEVESVASVRPSNATYGERYINGIDVITWQNGWRSDKGIDGFTAFVKNQGVRLRFQSGAWVYNPLYTLGLIGGLIPNSEAIFKIKENWTLDNATWDGDTIVAPSQSSSRIAASHPITTNNTNIWVQIGVDAGSWTGGGIYAVISGGSGNVVGGKKIGISTDFRNVVTKLTRSNQNSVGVYVETFGVIRVNQLQAVEMDASLAMPADVYISCGNISIGANFTASGPLDYNSGDGWPDARCMYFPGSSNPSRGVVADKIEALQCPMQGAGGGNFEGVSSVHRFAREFRKTIANGRSIVIVHCAGINGSTQDSGTWVAGSGSAYNNMIARVTAAMAVLPAGSALKGMIVSVGHEDGSSNPARYDTVDVGVKNIINGVRNSFSLPNMKVAVIGPKSTSGDYGRMATSLRKLDKDSGDTVSMSNVIYVPSPIVSGGTSEVLPSIGQRELGVNIASSWITRLGQ